MQLVNGITEEVEMALFAAMRSEVVLGGKCIIFFDCKRTLVHWWAFGLARIGCEEFVVSAEINAEKSFYRRLSSYLGHEGYFSPHASKSTLTKTLHYCGKALLDARFFNPLRIADNGDLCDTAAPDSSKKTASTIIDGNVFRRRNAFPCLASKETGAFHDLYEACSAGWIDRLSLKAYRAAEKERLRSEFQPFSGWVLCRPDPDVERRRKLNRIRSQSIKINPMEIMAASSRITTLCK